MKRLLTLFLFVFFITCSFANSRNLPGIKLITREEWGADSKYLFSDYKEYKVLIENQKKYLENLKKNKYKYKKYLEKKAKEKTREKYLLENYKNSVKADKVIKTLNWKDLWWDIAYKNNKTSIIIHHTAADYNKFKTKEDIEKYLRWTYYYHAIKRGWGDIGYNFLIDKFWNIYEGRAGWEWVVWANSKRNNVQSIWIALIWNFEIQKPTQAQLDALKKLSLALARKYTINPYKQITYHKESKKYPYIKDVQNMSIVWHRDTWYTLCPGKNLYILIPEIRDYVSKNLSSTNLVSVKKSTKKEVFKNLGKKFTLTDKIFIKFSGLVSCENKDSNLYVECNSKWITLQRKWYVGFKNYFITAYSSDTKYTLKIYPIFMDDIRILMKSKADKYLANKKAKYKIKKIKYKVSLSEAKKFSKENVKVLLYDLSLRNFYNISCTKNCKVITDLKTFDSVKKFKIDKFDDYMLLWLGDKSYAVKYVDISSNWGEIVFNEYKRKSYAGIPWNSFKGSIVIKKNPIKYISSGKVLNKYVVINLLPFDEYLEWVAEVNDQVNPEKAKVMALLIKSYVLFYFNKKNQHPSIPANASYNVIDDPRSFQKYVGAWYERTSKKWHNILESVKDKFLVYDNYIPILPYFNCSPWFTFSAEQKFWWIDTPYLQNSIDLWKCKNFKWHGVWLSWKWAEYLADKGLKMEEIIQWYFPGVKVVKN